MTTYNRSTVLAAVRTMLSACLSSTLAEDTFDWFSPADALVLEPDSHAPPTGPYFSVRILTHGVRDSMTGDNGALGEASDFVHNTVMLMAYGSEAYDALAYVLWFWDTDDAYDARAEVYAAGYHIVCDTQEVTEVQEFMETAFDVRGTTTITVGCLRTAARVTVDTSTVAVTGYVDDTLSVSANATLED